MFSSRQILTATSLVLALAALSLPGAAQAQDAADSAPKAESSSGGKGGKSPKRTAVNFEDQLVEGQTQKPELFYLLQQRNTNFKRLIRLRENFLPEMRKTSEEIGRGGSKGNAN